MYNRVRVKQLCSLRKYLSLKQAPADSYYDQKLDGAKLLLSL